MKKITLIAILLSVFTVNAQDPNIIWQRTIGGSEYDYLESIISTNDNGFLLGGGSLSNISGEKTDPTNGGPDMWVLKIDENGVIKWQNSIGGNEGEGIESIVQTPDGGFILVGYSISNISGDKTENSRGRDDYWAVKIDENGNVEWDKTYGGSNVDWFPKIASSTSGGYFICGESNSGISGDKNENGIGFGDYWVIKIDESGNILWQDTIGTTVYDGVESIASTNDGGCILGGSSASDISGDKTENSRGSTDYWIVKLSSNGTIEWDKTIGGNGVDKLYSVIQTFDEGYLLGGASRSDISGDKTEDAMGFNDFWVVKLNSSGNIEWQNTIGGNDVDLNYSFTQTNDGGYILGGISISNISGDKTENGNGLFDFWIVKINNVGIIEWQNTIGGSDDDNISTVLQTNNGNYVFAGNSRSNISGDKTENSRGSFDFWIIKHAGILGLEENPFNNSITLYPNPAKSILQLNTQNQTIDQVNIYTITGSKILQLEVDTFSPTVDVSSLATGVYYLQLYSGKNVALKKFVKE